MKRGLVLLIASSVALTGCTGGSKHAAGPSATTSAASGPTTSPAVGTSTARMPSSGPAAPVSSAAPASATHPAPSPLPAPSTTTVAPVTGPLTAAQAAAIEKHFDTVEDSAFVKSDPALLSSVESCAVLTRNSALITAWRAIGYTPKSYAAGKTTLRPAAFVEPAAAAYPQHFLYVENYRQPSRHFIANSLNVFVRPKASAPWKLCTYPNLFDGVALPKFATVARNVEAPVPPAAAGQAKHAAAALARYLTQRATSKVAPPDGLVVPFGHCPTKFPDCNPPGLYDPNYTPTSSVRSTYAVSTTNQPSYLFPLADGHTLAIIGLTSVSKDTAVTGYLQQDAHRSYWTVLVPPGQFHSVTQNDQLTIALDLAPTGAARVIGADLQPQSASTTPR